MHDPRTSNALRQLADLGTETSRSGWRWSIVQLQSIGRIALPAHARRALTRSEAEPEVRGRCNQVAWLLATVGPGVAVAVDGRGRVCLPTWLRPACAAGVLVGTRSTDGLVVVSSTALLGGLGDRLAPRAR